MRLLDQIQYALPHLYERISKDEEAGVFNPSWEVHSDESMQYFSNILGREVKGSDNVMETLREANLILSKENPE